MEPLKLSASAGSIHQQAARKNIGTVGTVPGSCAHTY
jgi:hypothetical protein